MTIRSLINFGESLKTGAGINIRLNDNGMIDISYCIVKREQDVIQVVSRGSGLSAPAALITTLKPLLPQGCRVHLNIEGKGVLYRETDLANVSDHLHQLAGKLFPMVKSEEFFLQKCQGNIKGFFALMRLDGLAVIEEIKKEFSVTSLSLGPFIISGILPFLETETVLLNGYSIAVIENEISSIATLPEYQSADIKIGDDVLPADVLLAYAASFSTIFGLHNLSTSDLPWLEEKQQSFLLSQHIYTYSRIALAFILITLVISNAIFFWLDERAQALAAQSQLFSGKTREKNKVQKQLSNLARAYERIGWSENIVPLYYADQVAKTVIREVTLTSLEIGTPDKDALKKERRVAYQSNMIKVTGVTDNPASLNRWLNEIPKLHWVKGISDQQYQMDNRTGRGLFEFNIEVK